MAGGKLIHNISRVYEICRKMWPDEFNVMFTADKEVFRDWLNSKTGLNEDHSTRKNVAVTNWLKRLEQIVKRKE